MKNPGRLEPWFETQAEWTMRVGNLNSFAILALFLKPLSVSIGCSLAKSDIMIFAYIMASETIPILRSLQHWGQVCRFRYT